MFHTIGVMVCVVMLLLGTLVAFLAALTEDYGRREWTAWTAYCLILISGWVLLFNHAGT